MREMNREEIQQVSLDILIDIHNFCVENNICYSLSGGTLLGAIRHNGFIPWDDDIDIQMPRPDYERFIHSYNGKGKYLLLCHELGEEYDCWRNLTRVCDTISTYVDQGPAPWCNREIGVAIDVLPCDGAPSNEADARKFIKGIKNRCRKALYWRASQTSFSEIWKYKKKRDRIKFLIGKLIGCMIGYNCISELVNFQKQFDFLKSTYFIASPHYGIKEWQSKENMECYFLHKFEDNEFYIMSGWDANLRSLYGDYMKLPPENQRVSHDFNRYYWKD